LVSPWAQAVTQTPLLQYSLARQLFSHCPQFLGSVATSVQPLLQTVWEAGQDDSHWPSLQI
jgi:hypothetical protein